MKTKKLLKTILSIPSESRKCDEMRGFLEEHCKGMGYSVAGDKKENLYVVKGSAAEYPCVVAHMDTVHKIEKGGIHVVEIGGFVTGINPNTMRQTGIGGDDKCGIYAALRCLDYLDNCKVAFFVDEEVGCQGSKNCELGFFKDTRFVLQADRRGHSDWVDKISGDPLGSDDFQKAVEPIIEKYGYAPCGGMMTDVMALRDQSVGVSVANMSAGYFNPHSDYESVSLIALEDVTNMMIEMCMTLDKPFPFVHVPKVQPVSTVCGPRNGRNAGGSGYRGNYGSGYGHWWGEDSPMDAQTGSKVHKDARRVEGREPFPDWSPMHSSNNGNGIVELCDTECAMCGCQAPKSQCMFVGSNTFLCLKCAHDIDAGTLG